MRNVSQKIADKIITHMLCSMILSPKIAPIIRQCGMILQSLTGHRWQYGAIALHAG